MISSNVNIFQLLADMQDSALGYLFELDYFKNPQSSVIFQSLFLILFSLEFAKAVNKMSEGNHEFATDIGKLVLKTLLVAILTVPFFWTKLSFPFAQFAPVKLAPNTGLVFLYNSASKFVNQEAAKISLKPNTNAIRISSYTYLGEMLEFANSYCTTGTQDQINQCKIDYIKKYTQSESLFPTAEQYAHSKAQFDLDNKCSPLDIRACVRTFLSISYVDFASIFNKVLSWILYVMNIIANVILAFMQLFLFLTSIVIIIFMHLLMPVILSKDYEYLIIGLWKSLLPIILFPFVTHVILVVTDSIFFAFIDVAAPVIIKKLPIIDFLFISVTTLILIFIIKIWLSLKSYGIVRELISANISADNNLPFNQIKNGIKKIATGGVG